MRWIHRTLERALELITVLLLWFAFLHTPERAATTGIDGSWAQAYGEILKSDLRLGVDIVFTFGPLGYFSRAPYDPELIRAAFLFDLGFKLALACMMLAALRRVPGALSKLVLFLFLVGFVQAASDAPAYLSAAIGGALLAERGRGKITAGLIVLFLATLSMIKFPYLVASGLGVFLASIAHIRRPGRAAGISIGYAGSLLVVFLLSGQRAQDLIPYVLSSLEIASGYSDAMSIAGSLLHLQLGVLLTAVLLGLIVAHARFAPAETAPIASGLLFAAIAYFAFKGGFVTQDIHTHTTFGVAGGLALLLVRRKEDVPAKVATRVGLGVVLASAGLMLLTSPASAGSYAGRWYLSMQRTAAWVLTPRAYTGALEQQRRALKAKHALPQIRAEVGDHTADIVDWDQGVLFQNDLRWRPRPVFHSYMTYSPALQGRNIEFLRSTQAPEYVLYQHQNRTDWFPTLAVSGILPVLLHDYSPVLSEGGYLLLERSTDTEDPLPVDRKPTNTGSFAIGDEVLMTELIGTEAPETGSVYIAFEIERSLVGTGLNLLYKPPEIRLVAVRDDGRIFSGRILPGMTTRGLLLRPLLLTNMDLRDHARGFPVAGVRSFRIEVDPTSEIAYRPTVAWRIYVTDGPPRAAATDRWKGGP